MINKHFKKIIFSLLALSLVFFLSTSVVESASDDGMFIYTGSHIKTVFSSGTNWLVNGTNKYLNFYVVSGSSGYGFRDNAGTMEYKNSGGSWAGIGAGGSMTALPDTQIYVGNASNEATATSAITVLSTGDVGIGTTSPEYALDVSGSIQTDTAFRGDYWVSATGNSMAIQPTGDTDDFFSFKTPADRPTIKREGGKYIYIESSNVNDVGLSFRKDADHSGTLNYYKDENLFGITSKDPFVLKVCADYENYIQFCNEGAIPRIYVASSSGLKVDAGGTNPLMLNHDGGNVGIGTTSPAHLLEVDGNGYFDGTLKIGAYTLPSTDGTNGYVLKTNGSGSLSWQADTSGGAGGGSGLWATTSDSLIVYPVDVSDTVVIGGNATTSTGHIFEVIGDSEFDTANFSGAITASNLNVSNWDTAYTWGDHTGIYDILGQATSTLASHTNTYNHANYDTAFGWGNHSGLYDILGQATSTLASHTTTYNHANYDTAYNWGDWNSNIDISTDTNLTVGATGIELDGDDIALTIGYIIPLSASTTNWDGFYNTPSGRITSGTGLNWAGNTLNFSSSGLSWAGNAITNDYIGSSTEFLVDNDTTYVSSDFVHDDLTGFIANEHLDWTASVGTIHADNYTDTNTTYTAGGTLLDLTGTVFSVNEGTLTDTKYCTYEVASGIVCNSEGGAGGTEWTDGGLFLYPTETSDVVVVGGNATTSTGNILEVIGISKLGDIIASTTNGIDINPASDTDVDLITVGVNGTPKFWWDESEDYFVLNNQLNIVGLTTNSNNLVFDAFSNITHFLGDNDGTSFMQITDSDSQNRFMFRDDGKFGIASSSPTYRLSINDGANSFGIDSSGIVQLGTWEATDIDVAYGGTGVSTLTDHGVLIGSGATAITALTVGTNGQILVGSTGADPIFADLTCGDNITCTTGAGTLEIDVDDVFGLHAGDTYTGVHDFGGATSFETVNSAAPVTDTAGEISVDTTDDDQFLYYGDELNVLTGVKEKCFTLATSSFSTYEDSYIWHPRRAITVVKQNCRVVNGTSVVMNISDGTNDMDSITCATTLTNDSSLSNNTWIADEGMTVEFGTVTGNVNTVNFCISYKYDRD